MAKKKTPAPLPDSALQYRDLSPQGQKILDQNMREKGTGVKAAVQHRIDTQTESIASGKIHAPDRIRKAEVSIGNLADVKKVAKNIPITMEGAAGRRVEHFEAGMRRSAEEHGPGTIKGSGAGWYYEHAGKVSEAAHSAGVVSPRTAAIASGSMSPQNSPANELATVTALMKQHAGQQYEKTDLKRGGTTANTAKAKKIITKSKDDPGNVGDVMPASTHPKVHSYTSAIVAAMPTHTEEGHRYISGEESEYRNRVGKVADVMAGKVTAEQGQLDLHGLQNSHQGLLSPTRNTAEDTWMSTITHGQSLENVGSTGRTNVGKTIASDTTMASSNLSKTRVNPRTEKRESALSDARYGKSAMGHAWNNEATIRAAEAVGQKYGVTDSQGRSNFPAVAVQETAWTEVRRAANKDPEYRKSRASAVRNTVNDAQFHQPGLF